MAEQDPLSILVVVGTRPDAIKLATVADRLRRTPREFRCIVAATAQHRELLDQVLSAFGISIDLDLDLMQDDQQPAAVLSRALAGLERAIVQARPQLVMVQGDTTTALAGALAGFYGRVPVAHVEAGLRTGDCAHPFPEEQHRRLIGRIASIHLAPTREARRALETEGVDPRSIYVTGNTVVDALRSILSGTREPSDGAPVMVVTLHRRESWGSPLASACMAIRRLSECRPELNVVIPVHPNPRVRRTIEAALSSCPRVRVVPPLPYPEFVALLAGATLVLTDSGGIQEEAPTLGVPVLVAREVTERPEGIRAGAARITGLDAESIVREVEAVLDDPASWRLDPGVSELYGDGRASERIVTALRHWMGLASEAPPDFAPGSSDVRLPLGGVIR